MRAAPLVCVWVRVCGARTVGLGCGQRALLVHRARRERRRAGGARALERHRGGHLAARPLHELWRWIGGRIAVSACRPAGGRPGGEGQQTTAEHRPRPATHRAVSVSQAVGVVAVLSILLLRWLSRRAARRAGLLRRAGVRVVLHLGRPLAQPFAQPLVHGACVILSAFWGLPLPVAPPRPETDCTGRDLYARCGGGDAMAITRLRVQCRLAKRGEPAAKVA